MRIKIIKMYWLYVAVISMCIMLISCNSKKKSDEEQAAQDELAVEEDMVAMVDEDAWIVEEFEINDIPVTSQSPKAAEKPIAKKKPVTEDKQIADMEEAYEIATIDYLTELAAEQEYVAETTFDVKEAVVPLEETQTVASFSKKGKEEAAFQVVSDGVTGEIDQIIFTDKRHSDVYDVSTGMSGKDVKKLRREMKHMIRKGKVFMYNDDSNVMYLMDAKNMVGDEVTAVDIENMNVSAVIWKDKKHHKKLD